MTNEDPAADVAAIDAPEAVGDGQPAPAASHRHSLLRNAGALVSGQATTWLITTIVMVIVPRRVGPDDMGAFRIATSVWAVLAMVLAFGTATLVTLDVARNQDDRSVHVGPVLGARLLGFVLVLPPLAVFVAVVGYEREVIVLLAIVAGSTLIQSIAEVASASLAGAERLAPAAAADVIAKLVAAVLSVVAVFATSDVRLVAVAGIVAACIYAGYLYRALARIKHIDLGVSFAGVRSTIRRGAPYFLIGVTLVAYNQIDVVVMSLLISDEEIGWYGTADVLFGTLLFVPTIVMSAILPRMARHDEEDASSSVDLLRSSFVTLFLFSVPIGLGTFVVADPVTRLLFGPAFDGTGPVLATYGLVLILTYQTILLGQYAIATGRQRLWNTVLAIAIPITVVFDIVMVPVMHDRYGNGAIAGAMAYIVTEGLMVTVGIWKLAPALASRSVGRRVVICLAAGGTLVAWAWPLRDSFILFPIAAGAAGYVIVLAVLRPFEPHERAVADRLVRRVPVLRRLAG